MLKTLILLAAAVLAAIVGGLLALGILKALQLLFGPSAGWWALGLGVAGAGAWLHWYGR